MRETHTWGITNWARHVSPAPFADIDDSLVPINAFRSISILSPYPLRHSDADHKALLSHVIQNSSWDPASTLRLILIHPQNQIRQHRPSIICHSIGHWFEKVRTLQLRASDTVSMIKYVKFGILEKRKSWFCGCNFQLARHQNLACTGGAMDTPRRSWRGYFFLSITHRFSVSSIRVLVESMGEFCRASHVSSFDPITFDWFRVPRQPSSWHRTSSTKPLVAISQWSSQSFCHCGFEAKGTTAASNFRSLWACNARKRTERTIFCFVSFITLVSLLINMPTCSSPLIVKVVFSVKSSP